MLKRKDIEPITTIAAATANARSDAPNVFQKFIGKEICFAQR
jgi:hypothetical protein